MRDCCQIAGFDFGRSVNASRHAIGDQLDQKGFFTFGRVFEQLNHLAGLLGGQWQRRNAQRSAFGKVETVSLDELGQHVFLLYQAV